jgi:hypothetical protein
MKLKQFFIAHNLPVDREFLLGLFSAGLTSMLIRPSAARWQLAGTTLAQPHLLDPRAKSAGRGRR